MWLVSSNEFGKDTETGSEPFVSNACLESMPNGMYFITNGNSGCLPQFMQMIWLLSSNEIPWIKHQNRK